MPEPIPFSPQVSPILPYQFHQIAIYVGDQLEPAIATYGMLGLTNWHRDNAILHGFLWGKEVWTKAKMAFNYDAMPMELEFLSYSGPNRHDVEGRESGFISHMSAYVDDVFASTQDMIDSGFGKPYHRFITTGHTNLRVAGVKRFIESIFDTRAQLGYDLKLIQKVPHDYDDADWLGAEF